MNRILTLIFAVALLAGNASAEDLAGLHWAARHNDTAIMKELLASGADVNAKDDIGWTPLHRAAWSDSVEAARILIANGADIKVKSKRGDTPLDTATEYGGKGVAKLLIKAGLQAKTAPKPAVAKNKCRQALDGAGVSIKAALNYMKTAESVTMEMLESALNSADSGIIAAKLHCK